MIGTAAAVVTFIVIWGLPEFHRRRFARLSIVGVISEPQSPRSDRICVSPCRQPPYKTLSHLRQSFVSELRARRAEAECDYVCRARRSSIRNEGSPGGFSQRFVRLNALPLGLCPQTHSDSARYVPEADRTAPGGLSVTTNV